MSEENLYKQKFRVDQWPTSKVTLYPMRATIVRQIDGVKLKAGLNEITISDLTSRADPDSIRVAGTTNDHPARINDLTIDLVPNTDWTFNHVSDLDSDTDDEDEDETPSSLKAATEALDKVNAAIREVKERRSSAESELSFVKQYASSVASSAKSQNVPDPKTMKDTLDLYNSQRAAHFDAITGFTDRLAELRKEREIKHKTLMKETKAFRRATKGKAEERKKKQAEKEEKKREEREKSTEKLGNVYRVRITIELPSSDLAAQGSSADAAVAEVFQETKLDLTYTTTSASWTPHYDLRLDTLNPSLSTLTYRAHFTNRTYETWSQAAITLSTSQASFGGLNEKIPQMEGWRVSLAKKRNTTQGENGLYSLAELKAKRENEKKEFGYHIAEERPQVQKTLTAAPAITRTLSRLKSKKKLSDPSSDPSSDSLSDPSSLRRMPPICISVPTVQSQPAQDYRRRGSPERSQRDRSPDKGLGYGLFDGGDEATLGGGGKAIQHSLAGSDTYGFTTTYELPTPRTIPSSPLARRHVIAEIPLPSLVFTHIVIPKLKAAAFLKAKVTNTSNVPLLPGKAGMTLDGSFMGNLNFPRCSPSETVVLELGVDQGVKVEYERPSVKHGTQGMLIVGKEEVGLYKRTMRITNSKPTTVSLVVLDQVPVPEDERLKVNITLPKGLKDIDDVTRNGVGVDGKTSVKGTKKAPATGTGGSGVASPSKLDDISEAGSIRNKTFSFGRRDSTNFANGPAVATTSTSNTKQSTSASGWGTAKATLKKNGEVRWDVDLVKGGCVALGLEWECRMPGGEGVNALS